MRKLNQTEINAVNGGLSPEGAVLGAIPFMLATCGALAGFAYSKEEKTELTYSSVGGGIGFILGTVFALSLRSIEFNFVEQFKGTWV